MMDNLTIARPYARAAFEFAEENNSIDGWKSFLTSLSVLVGNSNFASNAEYSSEEQSFNYAHKILDGLMDKYQENFLHVLLENNRTVVAPEIMQEFLQMTDKKYGIIRAEVISAHDLGKAELDKIKCGIEHKFSGSVELSIQIDSSLIAGFIIRIGDKIIDASVRTRLDKLSGSLRL